MPWKSLMMWTRIYLRFTLWEARSGMLKALMPPCASVWCRGPLSDRGRFETHLCMVREPRPDKHKTSASPRHNSQVVKDGSTAEIVKATL